MLIPLPPAATETAGGNQADAIPPSPPSPPIAVEALVEEALGFVVDLDVEAEGARRDLETVN